MAESTPFTAVQPKLESESAETPAGKVKKIGNNTYIYEGEEGAEMEHDGDESASQDDSVAFDVVSRISRGEPTTAETIKSIL